jgi:DNA-directed RNA polymerase subunit RPC12/RpoP
MIACSRCGRTVDEPPLTWTSERTERGQQWLCDKCTRQNVRSIEGRLDEQWW